MFAKEKFSDVVYFVICVAITAAGLYAVLPGERATSLDDKHVAMDRIRGDYSTSTIETVCTRSWFGLGATTRCHKHFVGLDN